jgi:hypothetical protein
MIYMKYNIIVVIPVLLGLAVVTTTTSQVLALGYWNGEGGDYWGHGVGYENNYLQQQPGPGAYSNGYSAGIADAVYDHDNNLAYNPIGQCVLCHSQDYWDNFKQGYDQQWSSYTSQSQEQSSTQGASINIYGNNYASVSIGQSNAQGQSATAGLPQLIGQDLHRLVRVDMVAVEDMVTHQHGQAVEVLGHKMIHYDALVMAFYSLLPIFLTFGG